MTIKLMLTMIPNTEDCRETGIIMLDLEKFSIINSTNHFEIITMIYTCQ